MVARYKDYKQTFLIFHQEREGKAVYLAVPCNVLASSNDVTTPSPILPFNNAARVQLQEYQLTAKEIFDMPTWDDIHNRDPNKGMEPAMLNVEMQKGIQALSAAGVQVRAPQPAPLIPAPMPAAMAFNPSK